MGIEDFFLLPHGSPPVSSRQNLYCGLLEKKKDESKMDEGGDEEQGRAAARGGHGIGAKSGGRPGARGEGLAADPGESGIPGFTEP